MTADIYYLWDRDIISTHTPLAGRDGDQLPVFGDALEISTHTPLAGRDYFADS